MITTMKDSVIERISKYSNQIKEDDTLMKHDIKLQELDQRLCSLENLINAMHNKFPVLWDNDK